MILEAEDNDVQARLDNLVTNCAGDRIYFCEAVLGLELEDWQRSVFEKLDAGETRISIRSGNGAGKTFFCAILALHFLLFRSECKIVVTSPSASQLRDGLFPETIKWRKQLPDFLKQPIKHTADRIYRQDNIENAFISFRTARRETPEALAGIHSKYVLCIVDEASGVAEEVYEAAQGTLSTPGAIFVMISNPTRLSGFFYRTHHDLKPYWHTVHLTSFDTSRVDQAFVDTIANTYGEDSDQYRVKVLGEFPTREEQTLIGRDVADAARNRDVHGRDGAIYFGLDIGRGGDPSALVGRQSNRIFFAKEYNSADAMSTVGWVKEEIDALPKSLKPDAIFVDSIGVGGPVADRLRELNYSAIDINVGETAALKGTYLRLRDELWYSLKFWIEDLTCTIEEGVYLEEKIADKILAEITSPLALFTSSGKNAVERKDDLRRRGIASPNLADAACLTFAQEGAVYSGVMRSLDKTNWAKPLEVETSYIY